MQYDINVEDPYFKLFYKILSIYNDEYDLESLADEINNSKEDIKFYSSEDEYIELNIRDTTYSIKIKVEERNIIYIYDTN